MDYRTPVDVLRELSTHPNPAVRSVVAAQCATDRDLRERFAVDPDVRVRFALASTVRSHPEVAELCADDDEQWVRFRSVTFCVNLDGTDALEPEDVVQHDHLAARPERDPELLFRALCADWQFGATEADRQRHSLFCVVRAGVALLLRDDCPAELVEGAASRVAAAVGHSWIFVGSGGGKGHMPREERVALLAPLRVRCDERWRHSEVVTDLLGDAW